MPSYQSSVDEKSHADLISHCITNFNITPDRAALSRIADSTATLQEMRRMRIASAEDALRRLARTHATLSTQHREMVDSYGGFDHASEIMALDTRKFRTAKAANDLEGENERLAGELERLREKVAELEGQGVEGDERVRRAREADDPTVLRLWLYRSLGIVLEQDERGEYRKAVVGDRRMGDVHVVNIDPGFRGGKGWYADYLWGTMQG
jgi:kinetochore protein Spc24, fungi type